MDDIEKIPSNIYRNEINSIIKKYILGEYGIDHFSLNLMFPNEMTVFSSTLALAKDFKKTGYSAYFKAYVPEVYENNPIYAWDDCYEGKIGRKIRDMIVQQHALYSGTMIIRKMPEFSIMYSVATKNKNPCMRTKIWNLADYILKAGDFVYNELRSYIQEYQKNMNIPSINHFQSLSDMQISSISKTNLDYLVKYNQFGLTDREIECIYWLRFGKNVSEIASEFHRSIETVKTHIKNAKRKMGCSTLSQLIAEAINGGLIR